MMIIIIVVVVDVVVCHCCAVIVMGNIRKCALCRRRSFIRSFVRSKRYILAQRNEARSEFFPKEKKKKREKEEEETYAKSEAVQSE